MLPMSTEPGETQMAGFDSLPTETLLEVGTYLNLRCDIAALSRASKRCYLVYSPILWASVRGSKTAGPVHWAAGRGNKEALTKALDVGLSPKQQVENDDPKNSLEKEQLLSSSPRNSTPNILEEQNVCFWEPIHLASCFGKIGEIEILLDRGADIDAVSREVCGCCVYSASSSYWGHITSSSRPLTALHLAICHGQIETAKFLLERGASVRMHGDTELVSSSSGAVTAIHHAAKFGHTSLLQFLVDRGYDTDVNAPDGDLRPPLTYALGRRHFGTTVRWLFTNGAMIEHKEWVGRNAPLTMSWYDGPEAVRRLVELHAELGLPPVKGYGVLHGVLELRNWSLALQILKSNIHPLDVPVGSMHRTIQGSFLLHDVTFLINALLEWGCDPEEIWEGETLLYYSVKFGKYETMEQVLLKSGVDFSRRTPRMPDGGLMFALASIHHFNPTAILEAYPDLLHRESDEFHRKCWSWLILWTTDRDHLVLIPDGEGYLKPWNRTLWSETESDHLVRYLEAGRWTTERAPLVRISDGERYLEAERAGPLVPTLQWEAMYPLIKYGLRCPATLEGGRELKPIVREALIRGLGYAWPIALRTIQQHFGIDLPEDAIPEPLRTWSPEYVAAQPA